MNITENDACERLSHNYVITGFRSASLKTHKQTIVSNNWQLILRRLGLILISMSTQKWIVTAWPETHNKLKPVIFIANYDTLAQKECIFSTVTILRYIISSAALNLEDTDTEQGDLDKVKHTVCLVLWYIILIHYKLE